MLGWMEVSVTFLACLYESGAVLINFAKRRKAIIITTYYTDIILMKSLKMLNSVTNNNFNLSLVGTHVMLTKNQKKSGIIFLHV